MRVIITAGGTGGHIYPALSIYDKIIEKEPDSKVLYIGTTDRMEKDIVPKRGIKYVGLKISGLDRKNIFKSIKTLYLIIMSTIKSKRIIKEFKPDIVIGVGGYVTAPVIYSAKKLKYKTVIHEQNSIFGLTNKILLKYSDLVFTSFPNTINQVKKYKEKIIFTGNPCSESAKAKKKIDKTTLGLDKNKKFVMIVMGSLGSMSINKNMEKLLPKFKSKDYEVVFITGKSYYEDFKNYELSNVKIVPYLEDFVGILKSADLLVSRAGATTLSEIIELSIPSILIPSPYVTANHQYKNAMDLVTKNSAVLLEENNIENLVETIDKTLSDEENLKNIKNNLEQFKINGSATKIFDEIKKLIGE